MIKKMPQLADRTLEGGREGLIRFIRDLSPQGSHRNAVTVVFDGQEGVCSPSMSTDVRIVFSRGCSADDVIRDHVENAPDPRQIICVTDDRDLAIACRHRGAQTWGVDEFVAAGRKSAAGRPGAGPKSARREDDGTKVVSQKAALKIDQELLALWLRKNQDGK